MLLRLVAPLPPPPAIVVVVVTGAEGLPALTEGPLVAVEAALRAGDTAAITARRGEEAVSEIDGLTPPAAPSVKGSPPVAVAATGTAAEGAWGRGWGIGAIRASAAAPAPFPAPLLSGDAAAGMGGIVCRTSTAEPAAGDTDADEEAVEIAEAGEVMAAAEGVEEAAAPAAAAAAATTAATTAAVSAFV